MSFRTVVGSRLFAVSFLFFVGLFFLLSANLTSGFNIFSLWSVQQNIKLGTNFARDSVVDSPALGLALTQGRLGAGYTVVADGSFGSAIALYDKTVTLTDIDVVALMRDSSTPTEILDAHLTQLSYTLQQISAQYDVLRTISQEKSDASKECYTAKRKGDRQFFEGVNESDASKANEGLKKSLDQAPCYISNRIESNAYAYMAQRVLVYQQVLARRNSLLTSSRESLLQTYPLLYGNVAEELITLKRGLTSINAFSYSDFDEYFRFSVPSANEPIPELERVLFPDGRIPDFDGFDGDSGANNIGELPTFGTQQFS